MPVGEYAIALAREELLEDQDDSLDIDWPTASQAKEELERKIES